MIILIEDHIITVFDNFILKIQIIFLKKCFSGPHIRKRYIVLMRKNNMLKYNYVIMVENRSDNLGMHFKR